MGDFISRAAAINRIMESLVQQETHDVNLHNIGLRKAMSAIDSLPAADVVEVVRCRDCKHRIVNEHYGEKGYMKLKAMCELDTGDPFELGRYAEEDDWFCADGKRKDGGQDT